jgi:hypothetical protein
MTKKVIDGDKLRETIANQNKATQERFDRADSMLLGARPIPVTEPVPAKSSLVKSTFCMPPEDHALIEKIRTKVAKEGHISANSEVIRAGLHALDLLEGAKVVDMLHRLEKMAPGRKGKSAA